MGILVARQALCPKKSTYWSSWVNDLTNHKTKYWVYSTGIPVDTDSSLFKDESGYTNNRVTHAKLVSPTGMTTDISDCYSTEDDWFYDAVGVSVDESASDRYALFQTSNHFQLTTRSYTLDGNIMWYKGRDSQSSSIRPLSSRLGCQLYCSIYWHDHQNYVGSAQVSAKMERDGDVTVYKSAVNYGLGVEVSELLYPAIREILFKAHDPTPLVPVVNDYTKSFRQSCFGVVQPTLELVVRVVKSLTSSTTYFRTVTIDQASPPKPVSPTSFLFSEYDRVWGSYDPAFGGREGALKNYWYQYLVQHAFLDACDHIPRLNDNMISNVLEVCQFIYKLVVKHEIDIPKSLSSAWLSYRYAYTTTRLDVEEAISFVHRHMDLGMRDYSCYGTTTRNIVLDGQDTTVTCRCKLRVQNREVAKVRDLWDALYTYGLQPNFYVLWDMIPYSFIVDWFLPVGEVAGVMDASREYTDENFDFKEIVFSLSYLANGVHCYSRWPDTAPPELQARYWLETGSASNRTLFYRVLDSASLLIGR